MSILTHNGPRPSHVVLTIKEGYSESIKTETKTLTILNLSAFFLKMFDMNFLRLDAMKEERILHMGHGSLRVNSEENC